MRRFAIAVFGILVWLALCQLTQAQTNLSISPPQVRLEAEPCETVGTEIKVVNRGDRGTRIKAQVQDFTYDKKGSLELLNTEEGKRFHGCGRWVLFEKPYQRITAGKTTVFKVEVKVPKNTKPAVYQTYLTFSSASRGEGNVKVAGQVASLLQVRVSSGELQSMPPVIKRGKIVSLRAGKYNLSGVVPFVIEFRNVGNVSLKTKANIEIRNEKNFVLDKIVFPKATIKAGKSKIWAKDWKNPVLFGKHTAVAEVDANLGKPWKKATKFWIVSWKLILAVCLGLIGIVTLGILGFTRLRIIKREQKQDV